jgi:hypothetical protein
MMMRMWGGAIGLIILICSNAVQAQQGVSDLDMPLPLDQRYYLMKSKAQSYQDFKVIKENSLDGFWRITKDSIRRSKDEVLAARSKIIKLENDVKMSQDSLKHKELAVSGIVFDSQHINVIGIPFTKSAFLTMITVVLVILGILLLVLSGTLKLTRSSLRERSDVVDSVQREFEEYKRKALDKETKILRQLQDERNRYHSSPR